MSEIDDLLRRHEDKTLEYKVDLSSPDRVVATLVAFANSAGGVMIIGVADKSRAVRGVSDPTVVEERLSNLVADRITPNLLVDVSIKPWRAASLVVAEVYPSSRRPHFDRTVGPERGTFVRIGSSNRVADESLRAELGRGAGQTFDETGLVGASLADLDPTYAAALLRRPSPMSDSDFTALRAVERNSRVGQATVGGYLLFRRDRDAALMPDAWVHAGRFTGPDRTHIADSKRIVGRLSELVEDSLTFLDRSLDTAYRIAASATRDEIRPVPPAALREAVVNAVVHADYRQQGAPLRVAVHSDCVVIENPGLLLPGLTIPDLYAGTSRLRNRMIGRVFAELGYIEQWGSGVRRMVDECRSAGKPAPLIEEVAGRVRVTFPFAQLVEPTMTERETRLLALLHTGSLTAVTAATALGVSDRTARKALATLVNRGLATVIGTSPNDPQRRYVKTM